MGACWVDYSSVVPYDIHIHRNIKHLCPAVMFRPHLLCAVTQQQCGWTCTRHTPHIYMISIEEKDFSSYYEISDKDFPRNLILLVASAR